MRSKNIQKLKKFAHIVTPANTCLAQFANLVELWFFIVFSFSRKNRLRESQTGQGAGTLLKTPQCLQNFYFWKRYNIPSVQFHTIFS